MPTIPVTDSLGLKVDLRVDEKSDAARWGLTALISKTSAFVTSGSKPLNETGFHSALFGASFKAPAIDLGGNITLRIKSGANAGISIYRSSDGTLFEASDDSAAIPISKTEAWISFSVDTSLETAAGATAPSGFGVSGEHIETRSFSTYSLVQAEDGHFPTVNESFERALSNFRLLRSASDIRRQPLHTVYECEVSGTFEIKGSYEMPIAASKFSLANMQIPFHQELQVGPQLTLNLTGSLAVTGEFRARCYRAGDSKLQLGLYKKKESDLSASFDARAGFDAQVRSVDLVSKFFAALPGVDFSAVEAAEPDRKLMERSLQAAADQGFSIALNSVCSASRADEAAVLYEIDLNDSGEATDAAINSALRGDWTSLGALSSAREIRNVLTRTHDSGFKLSLNLLGIYNYASIQDFVRRCTIMHDPQNAAMTITDTETAKRISISSMPFTAQDDRIRNVLDEAFLATAAYAVAGSAGPIRLDIQATQKLLVYNARADYSSLRKNLLLGIALQLVKAAEVEQITPQRQFNYFRLAAGATFQGDDALRLFFSNIGARTAHREEDLKRLGRQVLASLLDRSLAIDNARWLALMTDAAWAEMDKQKFPRGSPGSYSDWYDITFWAHAIATVAPRLKVVLDAAHDRAPADPAKDPAFMAEREALAKAIGEVTRKSHAAFERGWPLAVMSALCGHRAPAHFEAQWDGKKQLDRESAKVLAS